MQLAENNVCAVSSEKLRLRLLNATHLIGITDDEFAGLKWPLLRICSRDSASFDCRMADAVPESERFFLRWVMHDNPDARSP